MQLSAAYAAIPLRFAVDDIEVRKLAICVTVPIVGLRRG